eukprot:scaffold19777_cov169-Isochrysis_galbana.AAC.4
MVGVGQARRELAARPRPRSRGPLGLVPSCEGVEVPPSGLAGLVRLAARGRVVVRGVRDGDDRPLRLGHALQRAL